MDLIQGTCAGQAVETVECAIAIVWPEGRWDPVCEMFRVDHRTMTWTSKHYSLGTSFTDAGRLRPGETASTLAHQGTGSGVYRYLRRTRVTFVVAPLAAHLFDATGPREWTVERLAQLPGARVATFEPRSDDTSSAQADT